MPGTVIVSNGVQSWTYQIFSYEDSNNRFYIYLDNPNSTLRMDWDWEKSRYVISGYENENLSIKINHPTTRSANFNQIMGDGCVSIRLRSKQEDRYWSGVLNENMIFNAVFDGHAGKDVVNLIKEKFPYYLATHLYEFQGDIAQKIKEIIANFEKEVLLTTFPILTFKTAGKYGGSTAVFILVIDGIIYLTNLGDSRGIIFNEKGRILAQTMDHKPENPGEAARIRSLGGFVEDNRVDGMLAMSRAFGDFQYKENAGQYTQKGKVMVEADVIQQSLVKNSYFLLASDGLFERMIKVGGKVQYFEYTNQEMVNHIISLKTPLSECNNITQMAVKSGSSDDITLILGKF